MSDDSRNESRVEDILSGEDYLPKHPMSRIEELLLEGGAGGKLPEVDSSDNGKILKVKDGIWDKGEDISGDKLPQVDSSDNGKILKVIEGEWNIGDDNDRLPVPGSGDNGKILRIVNGEWQKVALPKDVKFHQIYVEQEDVVLGPNFGSELANTECPIYLIGGMMSGSIDNGKIFYPVEIDEVITLGIKENGTWECFSAEVVGGELKTYVERIVFNEDAQTHEETTTYTKQEITAKKNVQYVQLESSYPFSGDSVNLPEDINDILIANYVPEEILPTYLITSDGVIFTPDSVEVGGTSSNRIVYIYWKRLIHKFNSALQQDDIYEETLYYLTSKDTKTAAYSSQKAIESLPPVDSTDSGKVLAVNSTGAWDKATLPPTAQIVQISQLAYDELTIAEKEDPTKLYMISALALYEFHSAENGQVVVRIGPDGTKWFVNGLSIDAYGWDVPSDLEQYIPNASIYANRYTSATASSPDRGFGFTAASWGAGRLFNWNGSIGYTFSGTTYGVLNNTGGSTQTLPYTDPYQVDNADKLRIYYMNQLYSNLPIYKEVTQQEYDDLPSSKNSDGIIYFING